MDVRQFAFLARQPSAALKTRSTFLGLPKRGLALILANAMFWQPLLAQADGIVVSAPGTTLGQAGNGVPVVNIAAPNGSGLSHNQFLDYNVGQQGVILNNATSRTQSTQLGGLILGNQNLNGTAASVILNEVNGGSPSQLRGYTEVAGQSAHVIVANPYGITCNGCGFINTPQATLTTGKAVIENGQVSRYQVDQGSVAIDGTGLNASNVDQFEIITRATTINAQIQAKKLTIVAGRNDVDARTLNATARASDGSKAPDLAIDSSALGGMYLGAVKLVGTEAGVGVKLSGDMVAGGDIQIDAAGNVVMGQTSAAAAVNVKAQSLDAQGAVYAGTDLSVKTQGALTNQQTLAAKDNITLDAGGRLTNNGIIEAGVNADNSRNTQGDVRFTAQAIDNSGKTVIASRNLAVIVAQALTNQGGTLSGQTTNISADTLDNQNKGRVLSNSTLNLTSNQVLNTQGLIDSLGNLTGTVGQLNNSNGEISSSRITRFNASNLNNRSGQILGNLGLNIDLSGALDNRDGVLGSGTLVDIKAASFDNRDEGVVVSDGSLTARISGLLDNQDKGEITAKGMIDLQTGRFDNLAGKVVGKDALTLNSQSIDNRGGVVQADKLLKLQVDQLDNRNKGLISGKSAIVYSGTRLDNSDGLLSAVGPVTLNINEVQNAAGRISSQGDLTATIGLLQQQGGALVSQGNLSLTGTTLDNRNGGLIGTTKALTLKVDDIENRGGELSSSLLLNINGQRLDNSDGGKVLAGTDLQLTVAKLINQNKGLIVGKGTTILTGTSLDNSGGTLNSLNPLVITLDDALLNLHGLISSEGTLTINAGSLDNSAGSLGNAGVLSVTSRGALLNIGGSISADNTLILTSASLDNSQKGLISGQDTTGVITGSFDNSQGGRLISDSTLDITAKQVKNASGRIASRQALSASVTGLDQQGGELFSKTSLSLDLNSGQLNNQNGLINAPGTLLLKQLNDVNNQGGEISSAEAFALTAQNLDNSNGKLLSNQGLTLRIAQALNNSKGVISAASIDSHSESLNNSGGLTSSHGQLVLETDNTLDNQRGTLVSDGELLLAAKTLDNRGGEIAGKADATIKARQLDNQQGKLIATGALQVAAEKLDNRQSGLLGASKTLTLAVENIDNSGGELTTNADLLITSKKLDNSDGGRVLSGQTLKLIVDQLLNRNKGLLSAGTTLNLQGRLLDNGGGNLLSVNDTQLNLTGGFDNSQGQVSSESALTVNATQLTNTKGSLSSANDLTLTSDGSISNEGGAVVTDGALTLTSASLDNRQQGSISGKGAAAVNTGEFDNSRGGRLTSSSTLNLVAGHVTNQDDGRIGSQGALTANVTRLNQQGGKLFSNSSLSLDLNNGQLNNQNGLINAPGTLLLKQLNAVNNKGGEISSAEAFTLAAQHLDNDNGKLLSKQGLTLRIAYALDNVKGLIGGATINARAASLTNSGGSLTSRGDLELTVDGLLRNDANGLINATQQLKLGSAGLNNQSGTVLGGSAVILNAIALNNRDGGLINSQGNLTLTATSMDSSNDGEVSANGDIDLTLTSLTQNGGRLLGDKAVTVELANGDFDNRNGLLAAKGSLTLKSLRDLNNQSGDISSNLGFNVTARSLDNGAGKLISSELLTVNGTTLVNQKGLISGWLGLTVNGDRLDNRDNGTLSSRNGNVAVDLKDALLNSDAGALVSQGSLSVKSKSLDNSNKGILSSAAAQTLTLSGSLNNNQGGLIDSGAALDITTGVLTNAGGAINAQQAINATVTRLDNSAGSIAGNGSLTLDLLSALNNTSGKLAGAGPMLIKGVTDLENQNGQLASQSTLTLLTGSLDNSNNGTIAAKDVLQISASGAVRNDANGLIYSQNAALTLQAVSLANSKGVIQSQNGLALDVSDDLDNQSGKVIAENGVVTVKAVNIDNRGGVLSSIKGALEARTVGVLRNGYVLNNNLQGGIIQGQGLTLSALAGLDNNGGRISAQATDTSITTSVFDNRNGVLYANGLAGVTGTSLDNSNGQIAGSRIDLSLSGALNNRAGIVESDTQLTVKAGSLDNQNGRLRSLGSTGKTSFQSAGLLDNRNGVLETANTDLTLAVGSFLNAGGQLNHVGRGRFDISTANVIGAGGGITTSGTLDLNANTWINSSVIQAGNLNVNVNNFSQTASGQLLAADYLQARGGNWTNDGLIASDGVVDMQLGGSYSGTGRVSSLGGLYLSATQLSLNATSSITGGGTTEIKVGGLLSSTGRLTSNGDLTVEAGSLNNTGTLGGSQSVLIKTPNLVNDHGLIFSGQNTALQVGSLTNNYGDFYSLGELTVKGYAGAARANVVDNISGVMESVGDMSIDVSTLNNRGDKFEVTRKLVSGFIAVHCTDCGGDTYYVDYGLREIYEGSVSDQSPGAKLTSGGNFTFNGGDFLNSRSEVAAARNITINANNFSNVGASAGTIERTRIFSANGITDGTHRRFVLGDLWQYNKRNDDGPLTFHYIDDAGQFRTANYSTEQFYQKGSPEYRNILVDSETGRKLMYYSVWHRPDRYEQSEYNPNNLLSIPTQLTNYAVVSDVEVSRDGGAVQSAIVQAGGNVSINAAQNLTNSVIHQDYGYSAGVDRRQNTQGGGTGKPLLVHLNGQLPPDLSQQQVNPLSLPGFALPTTQNGLFRLSGQGATDSLARSDTIHPAGWTLGGESVSTLEHITATSSGGPRDFSINQPLAVATGDRAIDPFRRQPTVIKTDVSTLDLSVNSTDPGADVRTDTLKSTIGILPKARVIRLPDAKAQSNAHKYLIETNPVLTNLKLFMSSDYLLSNLGYDPDVSAKRLGDGLFEQRLVQQAVVARTGQRYIDGQTTDEGLFKYLMNNAIASKDQLNLSVGVTLTAQQVAALTHDIVWLEEHEVNGEKVLVPVLYLANANNRLAPNGALIQGSDVTLIAGANLENSGTLRASNDFKATAANDLTNSGLIEAGSRVDLLAGNNLVNKAGGIIAGRDVNIVAIAGDVINERTVTSMDASYSGKKQHRDYVDTAARIEAANDLTASAGRDFTNSGGVVKSGSDAYIDAGRDINIVSVQERTADSKYRYLNDSTTQLGATINAGDNLTFKSGRDIAVAASDITAKGDLSITATENIFVGPAADESHTSSKVGHTMRQEDHVNQVASTLIGGGDVTLNSGADMTLVSSRIKAGDEAYLVAGGNLELLAAQNSDYSLYDMKKKGSFGTGKTKRDEVTDVKNVGTKITSGGNLTLLSSGDQLYQAARLDSGKDISLLSGGSITFKAAKDLHQESHTKSNNSMAWNSAKGRGNTDETLRQSELISKGDLAITAAKGLHIDIKDINQSTVSQTIDAMVQADPQLAWLKEAEQRGDVDWQRVKEVHDSFKYSNSGMGIGAMLAVVIIVTVVTAGSGTAATVGASASGAATSAGISATTAAAIGTAASAAYTAAVVQSVVSTINNKGNLGAVLKDVTSTESLKGYLISGLVAGFASGVLDKAFGVSAENASKATHGFELASTDGLTKFVGYTLAEKGFGAVTNTAINGGSLKNNLAQASISAAADVLSAAIYNRLGTQLEFTGIPAKVGAHAIVGGLIAEAAGGSFRTGALAAGANEAFVASVGDKIFVGDMHDQLLAMTSQLIGVTVAGAAGGSDKELEVAGWVTQQATKFNSLDHPTAERLLNELKACRSGGNCTEAKQRDLIGKYEKISAERSQLIDLCETRACVEGLKANTIAMDDPVAQELLSFYRNKVSYDMTGMLVGNPGLIAQPAQGYDPWGNIYVTDDQIITAKYIKEGWLTPAESANLKEWENKTSWLDEAAGRKLSVAERAAMISNMGITLLTEGWGTKVVAGVGKGGKPGNGVTKDADGVGNSPIVTKLVKPCCFAAGTMVATPQGPRAIDTLSVGDIVWSKRETGGEPFAAAISATHIRTDQPIYQLKLKNIRADGVSEKETLLVTPGHPFYVPARHDFVPVIQLKSGDLLQSLGDGPTEGVSTRVESLELFLPQGKTYNLTVDVGHTFYVGKLKTWVHNVGLCDINGKPVVPRNAKNLEGGPLEKADKFSGHFMLEGGPANGTLYRADNRGNITSYAVYDDKGMILKRVDVTGDSHAGIPTPHAIDYGRNKLPDGSIRVQSPSSKKPPRGISAGEVP
jgi:filamentous hemagglutinin